ncbi:TPA_asm: maturation protein [ssRNA phage Gerhypos.2_23]|uniref:Maturation protein n=2 Tax=Leviviricetes TaxID=2842243 RepID=A0A8S5L170_9VIRU|nr:maturation protein [ssRNA phage Gerhypos.2_23]QDH88927.1 MAG: hypothetical protein H2Bulk35329_000004 [Leviviridae sp.]DAD51336.1 TPA_asm: maturation protein [ssRNA phage Gerhypos.2_23]
MPSRTRSSNSSRFKGTTGRFGSVSGGGTILSSSHACDDIVGSGDNAPFSVTHITLDGGVINKPNTGFFSSWFNNYVADVLDVPANFGHLGIIDDISNVDAATQAAARTNPSRPYVDTITEVLQLHELTDLLHRNGSSIISRYGQKNLGLQFGLLPIVEDIDGILNFSDQVHNRVQEINRLKERGLRRTVSCGSFGASSKQNLFIQTQNTFIRDDFDVSTTLNVRAHCRWLPTGDPSILSSPREVRELARRAVQGITMDASTAWELMPWSWLLDWAGNVGQYFAAHRNIVPAVLSDVSVMRHTRTSWSWKGTHFDDVTVTPINVRRESKTRATSFTAPIAHFPFLSGNQMGILASLAVARL